MSVPPSLAGRSHCDTRITASVSRARRCQAGRSDRRADRRFEFGTQHPDLLHPDRDPKEPFRDAQCRTPFEPQRPVRGTGRVRQCRADIAKRRPQRLYSGQPASTGLAAPAPPPAISKLTIMATARAQQRHGAVYGRGWSGRVGYSTPRHPRKARDVIGPAPPHSPLPGHSAARTNTAPAPPTSNQTGWGVNPTVTAKS